MPDSIIDLASVTTVRGKDRAALMADPNFVYVGHKCAGWPGSVFGNPFRVQRQRPRAPYWSCCATAEEAIKKYAEWLKQNRRNLPMRSLVGKKLGCWCGDWNPGEPEIFCHAVILAKSANALFDVLGVQIHGPRIVRVMGESLDADNAEAFIGMAIIRRGVEEEFFVTTAAGSYKDGETWEWSRPKSE
jgi:Domain of unknown function (DUF4326)